MTFDKDLHSFDSENYCITLPSSCASSDATVKGKDIKLSVFDKVTVNIWVEKDKNTQRGKVRMSLVSPIVSKDL